MGHCQKRVVENVIELCLNLHLKWYFKVLIIHDILHHTVLRSFLLHHCLVPALTCL